MADVVALVRPEESQQARYYKRLLDEQRACVDDDLARLCSAFAETWRGRRHRREERRLREAIRDKRREHYEIDCLLDALNSRFLLAAPALVPARCFDIEVTAERSHWIVGIPELDETFKVARREDVEMLAREHIAVIIGTAIAQLAVRVVVDR
jgi:hypothetical protein